MGFYKIDEKVAKTSAMEQVACSSLAPKKDEEKDKKDDLVEEKEDEDEDEKTMEEHEVESKQQEA